MTRLREALLWLLAYALAALSEVPTDRLIGSDALAKVLRLAAIHGEARDRELRALAASQVDAMWRAA